MVLFAILVNIAFGVFFQHFIKQQEDYQIDIAKDSLASYISDKIVKGQGNVNDRGHWDETYHFIETTNEEYIQTNLIESTFENLDLSFIIIIDGDDNVIYQQYYSLEKDEFAQFPSNFHVTSSLISFLKLEKDISSMIEIGGNYYFISSTDVTDSTMTKTANGKMIIGRELDSGIRENIEAITGCKIKSISILENSASVSKDGIITTLDKTYSPSGDSIFIKLAIPNKYRIQDSIEMDFELPRTLYVSSINKVSDFGILNTVLFVIITLVVVIILTNIITKPFNHLLQEVISVDTTKDKYAKLAEVGNKEFIHIRKSINSLLTKIENNQERITNMALYDQLTGIPNRTLFNDLLRRDISLSSRNGKIIGVVFIDLDDFKSVNDTLGHEMGDELIRQISDRLTSSIRKHDTVARFGGDEFLLILNNMIEISDLQKKVGKIVDVFREPFILNEMEYFVTCSAGVSVYPVDGEDSETLIKNADIAMYNSKSNGKNAYSFCSEIIKEDITEKIELTNYLYRALERKELVVYYQPQICIENKKIVGFEALLRWNHPTKGLLLPGKFISLAEHTRLINPIGKWVLETVCKQIKLWADMGLGSMRIAVNVSLIQFLDPDFLNIVKSTILGTEIDPQSIEIEITESIAINKSLNIEPILYALKEFGVSIAIDDFGTEYSTLTRLKNLSVDRIKMDMQFVHSISKSDKDDAIAKIIIQLAKNLNMNVIAEGIETENQMNFLSMNACDEAQGFFYYRPMKAEDAEKLLLEQRK
jgi:diguanylate cyclase (GGDEF)-like protein